MNQISVIFAAIELRGLTMAESEDSTRPLWRWPRERLAQAALLAGSGWSWEEIAAHPDVQSSPGSVRRALRKAGLGVRDWPNTKTYPLVIPRARLQTFEQAAAARRCSVEQLLGIVTRIIADDPALLDNIVDDGVTTAPLAAEAAE